MSLTDAPNAPETWPATSEAIDRLYAVILSRKGAAPETSYTAKLFSKGLAQCAKKLGEEGVEAALAGALGDKDGLIAESADVLYHLLVVWAAVGVTPDEVFGRLVERQGKSGLKEKANRHDAD